ncbi:lasso peptide biosynthesis B2 protein [Wenzhouxiangella marina]|uniref:Microcin J25-processing protein McjB C-terminal domain-containing protein n=1 Tax=Wenzhouxiangella marina TaxID=1579979 RepID=A0A0K0XYJ5_9GAMM|nr:lasso peptide biosynthesis B2 protein [Wenzhouxiangella marina]AKS42745.1 hypothetical protein WM2015_2383 [Wenzhouxiangella marina]MBB6087579.1 hypothetical protein [Wenzhouxiangella marina]
MLARWRQLSRMERRALWPAAWRLLLARLCLLGGIRRAQRWLGDVGALKLPEQLGEEDQGQARPGGVGLPEPDMVIWQHRATALKRIGARIPDTHCLARALALRWWMRSQGLPAEMRIGVRQGSAGIESHAWVELDGIAMDETAEIVARFTTVDFGEG